MSEVMELFETRHGSYSDSALHVENITYDPSKRAVGAAF